MRTPKHPDVTVDLPDVDTTDDAWHAIGAVVRGLHAAGHHNDAVKFWETATAGKKADVLHTARRYVTVR